MSCLPLTLAMQLYFKAEGLDVSLIDCFDEGAALRLLASGGAGGELRVRALYGRRQGRPAGVCDAKKPAPQVIGGCIDPHPGRFPAPSELRGRRIGVSAIDSVSQSLVTALLSRAGLALPR